MSKRVDRSEALRLLREAAAPYGLEAAWSPGAEIPDLVLFRPAPDGREVVRLRLFEPMGQSPYLQAVVPMYVTEAEAGEVERHMSDRLVPVILDVFSYPLWMTLPDGPRYPRTRAAPGDRPPR